MSCSFVNRKEGAVVRNSGMPEILVRVRRIGLKNIDVRDCRELSQAFQELRQAGSPYAKRIQTILKKVMPRFSEDELRNR